VRAASHATIRWISGPVLRADVAPGAQFRLREAIRVGPQQLLGEVIRVQSDEIVAQVYEDTTGLKPGVTVEGSGELRFGPERYPIRAHDVIACPTGGPEVAHQIINTGTVPLRYLALSNRVPIETCEYPDSNKIMIGADLPGGGRLWKMFRAENTVDYYDRENTQGPAR
jgi:hypothetical protein